MTDNFIKLIRGDRGEWLQEHFPNAFLLLTTISRQARRYSDKNDGLEIGDAIIGRIETSIKSGLSHKAYRIALEKLIELGMVEIVYNPKAEKSKPQKRAIKRAIKSMVVCLIDSEVYDINSEDKGHQKGHLGAIKGPETKNEEEREESSSHIDQNMKGDNKKIIPISFSDSKNQEDFEKLMKYAQAGGLELNPKVMERWLKAYNFQFINKTISDYFDKADHEKYKDKYEAWLESTLKAKWNFQRNLSFIEAFKEEKKWIELSILKNYCRDEISNNDYPFSLPHETFLEQIMNRYNLCKENL